MKKLQINLNTFAAHIASLVAMRWGRECYYVPTAGLEIHVKRSSANGTYTINGRKTPNERMAADLFADLVNQYLEGYQ